MEQEINNKAVPKEYIFSMSNTQVEGWTSMEHGVLVSGRTDFTMNIDTETCGTTKGVCFIVPDFRKELSGTIKLDSEAEFVELKDMPVEEAKKVIHDFLKQKPGSRTSDIILSLGIDPDIVLEALSQLKCENKVEGRAIDGK